MRAQTTKFPDMSDTDRYLLDYQKMAELEKQFGSSFYLLNMQKLRNNYKKINEAFKSRYDHFNIGYSYKTNYVPYLCKELDRLGAYAEVVSRLEYDLALRIGVRPEKIIFNGPVKTEEDIETALEHGSLLNIDSLYEIDYIKKYCLKNNHKLVKLGLRVNFDLCGAEKNILQEGYEISRFGLCVENGNFQYAVAELNKLANVQIAGLHAHFSTRERKVETYQLITKKLSRLAKEYIGEGLEYIDIGGGIFGELPASMQLQTPSFADYAEAVCSIMNAEFCDNEQKPYLILEPGISMVANVFSFAAKVLEVKKVQNQLFVLIDGSVHNIKPTMHKRNLPMQLIQQSPNRKEATGYHIVGYTCMEKDYLAHGVDGELPARGDYIMFENVGAYTIVFNPPFIKERPAIVAVDSGQFFGVRKKETLKEFVSEELYYFQR
ncbi:diaminopimelate decarboxylase [Bacillus rubiinfantis]|uniref:diaminopimelate decarboxylase n=1 Tax=Bacillus rubiinfantis TaxID=1499680 RepID=UPI000AEC1894|nr:diaminopimelate decarboxylase [Bacillus rubiinfantis]